MKNTEERTWCSSLLIVENDSSVKKYVDEILNRNPESSTLSVVSGCLEMFSSRYPKMTLKDWHSIVSAYIQKKNSPTSNITDNEENVAVIRLTSIGFDINYTHNTKSYEKIQEYLRCYNFPHLSYKELKTQVDRYRKGNLKALDILVKSNMKIVIAFAIGHLHKGVELEDLIQEGTIGLINAIKHYDYNITKDFYRYAFWWISRSVLNALATIPFTVKIPLNMIALHQKVWSFIETFEQEHNYFPLIADIDTDENVDFNSISFLSKMPARLIDITENRNDFDNWMCSESLIEDYIKNDFYSYSINKLLKFLTPRESDILRSYFGIGRKSESLLFISIRLGLTTERVRQIKEKTLMDLYKKINSRNIESYIDIPLKPKETDETDFEKNAKSPNKWEPELRNKKNYVQTKYYEEHSKKRKILANSNGKQLKTTANRRCKDYAFIYSIENYYNVCYIFDTLKNRLIYSSIGIIQRRYSTFYRGSFKDEYFSITIINLDGNGHFKKEEIVVLAECNSDLYKVLDINNYWDQIQEINNDSRCRVKVNGMWYGEKGNLIK